MPPTTTDKLLIVNADDYGYTAGVSEGIRRAHRQGIVSSTSVMMTMPAAVRELGRLRDEAPALGVGVHLTVTEGRPFRLAGFWRRAELAQRLGEVAAGELRAEWQAQIEALLATGLPLTHLDSHHHAAYRHGKALAVLFDLARTYRVPVRNPYPIGDAERMRWRAPSPRRACPTRGTSWTSSTGRRSRRRWRPRWRRCLSA